MNKRNWFMAAALTVVSTTVMAQTSYPWMDTSKSFRERAELLCRELTLREKVDQLGNNVSEPIKRDGQVILPSYQYWNEALHGVARSGAATSFPESGNVGNMGRDARKGMCGGNQRRGTYLP